MARLDLPPPRHPSDPQRRRGPSRLVAKSAGSLLRSSPRWSAFPGSQPGRAQREKLAQKLTAMRRLDFFEILGVKWSATRERREARYFALAKEYHPDKHFSSPARRRGRCAADLTISSRRRTTPHRFRVSASATSPSSRRGPSSRNDADVGGSSRPRASSSGRGADAAAAVRRRGPLFREAIALYPDEGEFHAWEGWRSSRPIQPADDAIRSSSSRQPQPKMDKGYLFSATSKGDRPPDRADASSRRRFQANRTARGAAGAAALGKQRR